MAFRVLFMHVYALLQLYVIAFRTTARLRLLRYLFLIGALSSLPAAIVLANVARYYFPAANLVGTNAAIEELVKALPVFYLFWRTTVGSSASLLDGVLCGAAVGAGFGFGEDAIYMIENASLSYSPFTSWGSVIGSWLPGGWANGSAWFAGHLVMAAFAGAGIALGRRLMVSRWLRAIPVLVMLSWVTVMHAQFNQPGDSSVTSLGNMVFYTLGGAGAYMSYYLLALVVAMLVMEEVWVRRTVQTGIVPPPSGFFADLGELVASMGRGWKALRQTRKRQRMDEERVQLSWELTRLRPRNREELQEQTRRLESRPIEQEQGSALSWGAWKSLREPGNWSWKLYRLTALPVMAYGFWLVFLSPEMTHSVTQQVSRSAWALWLGVLGVALMFGRFGHYLWIQKHVSITHVDDSEQAIRQCQRILLWSGFFTCLFAFKDLYDTGAFPYPLRADALGKFDQARSCLGPRGFDNGSVTTTSPLHSIPRHESGEASLTDDFKNP